MGGGGEGKSTLFQTLERDLPHPQDHSTAPGRGGPKLAPH